MGDLEVGQDYVFIDEGGDYSGTVVYIEHDDSMCIIRLIIDAEAYTEYGLYYHEVKNRYPDFEDDGYQETEQRYICIDTNSGVSLFRYDENSGEIGNAIFDDDDHSFLGYDNEDLDISEDEVYTPNYILNSIEDIELINIRMPENELANLENDEIIMDSEDDLTNISPDGSLTVRGEACSLYRSLSWLVNCDCAIITAWRSSNTRKINDTNNNLLQKSLRAFGYGVSRVKGVYSEVGKEASKENSFLVFDLQNSSSEFYKNIKTLSQQFEQDCFLYKRAGRNTLAYLIGTNDKFGWSKKVAGRLHIGSISAKEYSEIGSGRISFE